MDIATILAIVGIVLAIVVPVAVALWVEALKKAHLDIASSEWRPISFVTWTFATVRVRNKPIPPRLGKFLPRESAHGCVVEIDYYRWDSGGLLFPTIHGRWSSAPEPLRQVPPSLLAELPPGSSRSSHGTSITPGTYSTGTAGIVSPPVSGGTAPSFTVPATAGAAGPSVTAGAADAAVIPPGSPSTVSTPPGSAQYGYSTIYDPEKDRGRIDVAVSPDGEEVAVAILRDGEAFAFSTESYGYDKWGNPAWHLDHGTYRIVVRVLGSGIREERQFKLQYLSNDVSKFRLEAIDPSSRETMPL